MEKANLDTKHITSDSGNGLEKAFDPEQLKIGTKVEMEHTDDLAKAKKIAKDHLKEDPKYYTKSKAKNWGKKEAMGKSIHFIEIPEETEVPENAGLEVLNIHE